MMLKKIKILEMSPYVWELITDLCLHKRFCANLTALVGLNQSLILKLIFNIESQDETISSKFNLLETFQGKEILRFYGVSLTLLGKPSDKKSAVFLSIVQKAFDPPPLSFEHHVVNFFGRNFNKSA